MKAILKRVESVNRSGTSKSGNPYTIDQTNVVVDVPFNSDTGFGSKELIYQYGDHTKYHELSSLKGKLPTEVEIELGTEFDNYDNPITVVKSVKASGVVQNQSR